MQMRKKASQRSFHSPSPCISPSPKNHLFSFSNQARFLLSTPILPRKSLHSTKDLSVPTKVLKQDDKDIVRKMSQYYSNLIKEHDRAKEEIKELKRQNHQMKKENNQYLSDLKFLYKQLWMDHQKKRQQCDYVLDKIKGTGRLRPREELLAQIEYEEPHLLEKKASDALDKFEKLHYENSKLTRELERIKEKYPEFERMELGEKLFEFVINQTLTTKHQSPVKPILMNKKENGNERNIQECQLSQSSIQKISENNQAIHPLPNNLENINDRNEQIQLQLTFRESELNRQYESKYEQLRLKELDMQRRESQLKTVLDQLRKENEMLKTENMEYKRKIEMHLNDHSLTESRCMEFITRNRLSI